MNFRVIGGRLKGKPLVSPERRTVRPTAGLVREAVFNILLTRVEKTIVLDLFAGTGALGIEALSRGADRAVFVDNSRAALTVLQKNIRNCGLEPVTGILRQDATRNLSGLTAFNVLFDLVFMDPPYERNAVARSLAALAGSSVLKTGAFVVAEHSPREPIACNDDRFSLKDRRQYGRTVVSFLEYMVN